jgi:hypothetical protein
MERGPDVASDHYPMTSTFGLVVNKVELLSEPKWQIKKAKWKEWQQKMSSVTTPDVRPTNAEIENQLFINKIEEACRDTIPKSSGALGSHRYTGWWDVQCSKSIALR